MHHDLYQELYAEGLLSDESSGKLNEPAPRPNVSLFWELRTLLYIGVVLLAGGLGLLVYENIDTIGHTAVLALISFIAGGSLFYCFKTAVPFSREKTGAPNPWFDYVLLLGCISLLSFIGYWQYQYKIFGMDYGLASFIPMVFLFFAAYYFDHLGVLGMAIANLAVWMGVSVTPKELLAQNDFDKTTIINTYLLLGTLLVVLAIFSVRKNFKKHFKFSYQHYAVHAIYIALLAGYFHFYYQFWTAFYMLALYGFSVFLYYDAIKSKSFYFLLLMTLYSYVAISAVILRLLVLIADVGAIYLGLLYFIGSAIGLIFLLIHFNRRIKTA